MAAGLPVDKTIALFLALFGFTASPQDLLKRPVTPPGEVACPLKLEVEKALPAPEGGLSQRLNEERDAALTIARSA